VEAMAVRCDLGIHLGIQKDDDSWSAGSEFGVTPRRIPGDARSRQRSWYTMTVSGRKARWIDWKP
jgi:hypothetical protein